MLPVLTWLCGRVTNSTPTPKLEDQGTPLESSVLPEDTLALMERAEDQTADPALSRQQALLTASQPSLQ